MKIHVQWLVLVALAGPISVTAESVDGADADTSTGNYYVAQSEDDAEEGSNGQVNLTSDDLDLGQVSGFESAVAVGIRFEGIRIPKGSKIKQAFALFTKDEPGMKADPTRLTIRAELAGDAKAFKEEQQNISSRRVTDASVTWSPPPWNPEDRERKRSPDLSTLIQQVVDQRDWKQGNALVLIITGTGERDAISFDGGGRSDGPMLHVETD